jgi:hypothetical protein
MIDAFTEFLDTLFSSSKNKGNKVISSTNEPLSPPLETWVVIWESRFDDYGGDTKPELALFTNIDDAIKYKEALENAFKLLRYTHGTKVTIRKN